MGDTQPFLPMRTDAQLDGFPTHRATLVLTPDTLVFSGRTRRFEAVHRTLPLAEVVRVETFDAEDPFNLQVWTAADSWRLWVTGPVVWRFAIEDAMRRLGINVPAVPWVARSRDSIRPERSLPRTLGEAPPHRPRTLDPQVASGIHLGDLVPLHLTIDMPGGVRVGLRLLGEVEAVEGPTPDTAASAASAQGDGRTGDGQAGDGEVRSLTDVPQLRVPR